MVDRDQPYDPPQDTGAPDAVERDPAALSSAEDLDEDRLRVDPLEEGMDPPERWSAADRRGTTPWEQANPAPLDERLAEEEPDVQPTVPDADSGTPTAEGADVSEAAEPAGEAAAAEPTGDGPAYSADSALTGDMDADEEPDVPQGPDDLELERTSYDESLGTSADVAGGSVPHQIRTPPAE